MGNSRLLFLLKQRDRQDLDLINEAFPLPEVTRAAISAFPEPRTHASFVYYLEAEGNPIIANGRNQASRDMLITSDGESVSFNSGAD